MQNVNRYEYLRQNTKYTASMYLFKVNSETPEQFVNCIQS